MPLKGLDKLFNPKSIAVIGASNTKGSVGYALMRNLIGSGFDGIIYPINPNNSNIMGVKSYPSVKNVPDKIDLAIITTKATTVPGIVEECGSVGVAGLVIISAGFKETDGKGQEMFNEILKIARKYHIRILGPNCLGFIKPSINLNATFANKMAPPGKIAFISQSGALGTAVLDWAIKNNIGFSYFVSLGDMVDVGFDDLIDYFGSDPNTASILIYMESLTNARLFMSASRGFARSKPIIILKAGKSAEGSKAAMSHTGSIAGNDLAFDVAFKRAGIIRVETIEELFDSALTLSMQPRPCGNKLAIVTNAGGPGVITTDFLIEHGGKLAQLSEETMNGLNSVLPPQWSHSNPVDILGDSDAERYRKSIELCLGDPGSDAILILLTPQAMTNPAEIAKSIINISTRGKTILACFMGADDVAQGMDILEKNSIPVYNSPEDAVRCFLLMYQYTKNLELLYETPSNIPENFSPNTVATQKIIDDVIAQGRCQLNEVEAKTVLSNYGIPVEKSCISHSPEEAANFASELGFPVVLKILSSDIIHKTDIGGVKLDIKSETDAGFAYLEIIDAVNKIKPAPKIEGVLVQKMRNAKYELLIGSQKDPVFGPVIVFGMGGVAVEVFKDTNAGLPPLTMALAKRIIEETKIYKLLKGYRGMKGADITSIEFLLYKFSYLVMDFPQIKEIDINPFLVEETGGVVVDAKIVLDKDIIGKKIIPYSHLVISPYPKEYTTSFKMTDHKTCVLRAIRPEDEPLEAEMFRNFSPATQRLRFFQLIKDITHELLIRYTQIDYDREIAIIAEVDGDDDQKKMAGVVRLIEDPDRENAEFAIVVADPWQQKGIGNKLTDHIINIAKNRGLKKIYAEVLRDNNVMIHMFEKRGFNSIEMDESVHMDMKLE